MTDGTAYSLRKWASEMAMGYSLSSEQAPLLKEAADEIDRLQAESDKLRTTLEIIAEGATDKLKALQARTVLANIGPSTGEQGVNDGK